MNKILPLLNNYAYNIDENAIYVLSLSYGKDSIACLGAIKKLGLPLHRIITADVWATQDIPADFPEVTTLFLKVDKWILENLGITVEHYCATDKDGNKLSYEDFFYRFTDRSKSRFKSGIWGFPMVKGAWCNSRLKMSALKKCEKVVENKNVIQYIGIAFDEPKRIERHNKKENIFMPLVEIGWEEDYCGLICSYNNLLNPSYIDGYRDGCWFCHNQGVEQLRLLRRKHPKLWKLLLKWDNDSPIKFKSDGHTVHDFDKRFELEDKGIINKNETFYWKYLENPPQRQLTIFDIGE